MHIKIVTKEDQRKGKLTKGIVKDILTCLPADRQKAFKHPNGIKVRLVRRTLMEKLVKWTC